MRDRAPIDKGSVSMRPRSFIDAILALPALGRALLSPDGRQIAWTWYRKAPAANIYVAPSDGSGPPRRLTETQDDTQLLSWAPDGRSLVVAEDRGGDERGQLFRLTLDRAMTPLTEPSPAWFPHGGEIDPSGRYLVLAGNVDPATGRTLEASWVFKASAARWRGRSSPTPMRRGSTARGRACSMCGATSIPRGRRCGWSASTAAATARS